MGILLLDTSKRPNEQDIASLDYYHHEFRLKYREIMDLLANVEILNRCITHCANLTYPEDTSSSIYLDYAEKIQTYFINSQALYEMLTTTKGYKSGQKSAPDEFKALVTFAKVVRNKVAHEGIWIPYATRGFVKDKGPYQFFSLPKSALRDLIFEASMRDKKQAVREFNDAVIEAKPNNQRLDDLDNTLIGLIQKSNEWTQIALRFLDTHYSDKFDVHSFMLRHFQVFVPWVIDCFERRANSVEVKQFSELCRKVNVKTLDDKLKECKQLYQAQLRT